MYTQAIQEYENQIEKYGRILLTQKSKHRLWSLIRLFSFLALIAIVILAFANNKILGILAIYVSAFVFVKIMRTHDKITREKEKTEAILKINENEKSFLKDLRPFRYSGERYLNNLHPYTSDLDIFGENSLYQYLERSCTRYGRKKIADRLSKPISKEEILANQESVTELETLLDWRQGFMAYDLQRKDEALDEKALTKWKESPSLFMNNNIIAIMRFGLPILALAACILLCYYVPWYLALLAFLPSILLQRKYANHINEMQNLSEHSLKYISSYSSLIEEIENGTFTSENLNHLQSQFLSGEKASKKLKKMTWYLDQIDIKNNFFGAIFNILTLYDIHFTFLLEQWKEKNKEEINAWTDSLAEFEFLQSLANLGFNNSTWTFPRIGGEAIACHNIGHPLIAEDKRICNTIDLAVKQHIKLITGSNMAGKSTFQRTIGMNMVLAYCGSRVCASALQLPILQVLSSMRTQDDLSKDASGFYAELLRLKMVLEEVQASNDNYFFIDEILKGTNTDDRHKGSKALIKQLLQSHGAGLISTHDLELAKLEDVLNGQLENICFEVDVIDDKLSFDYTVKKGVSKSFNATKLMESIGINMDD